VPKDEVRAPAVAGSFYPFAVAELQSQLDGMLAFTPSTEPLMPKALIAPHAGYIYSGPVAASAYAALRPFHKNITRVVLLGPTHRKAVRGLALPTASAFATPLGQVAVDADAATALHAMKQVCTSEEVHALEHSLEVHLPFLQRVIDRFKLVPLAVGDASTEEVAQVLNALWGGDETLIIVSSDLSHYLPYDQARMLDEQTARMILGLEPRLDHQRACGATPVNGLLRVARERGLRPQLLDLRNSGDTAGDRNQVVGYASFAFYPVTARTQTDAGAADSAIDGKLLVSLARASIASQFGLHFSVRDTAPFLHKPGASFITLKSRGELRGCIGTLTPYRSLVDDVRANACAAAFKDPRFAPLRFDELGTIRVEVSLLSALERMHVQSEADALEQMRPGVDGVTLEVGDHKGTFLPQVWENLTEPKRFLGELKRKAGLPADFWDPGVRLSRYTVAKWAESES